MVPSLRRLIHPRQRRNPDLEPGLREADVQAALTLPPFGVKALREFDERSELNDDCPGLEVPSGGLRANDTYGVTDALFTRCSQP